MRSRSWGTKFYESELRKNFGQVIIKNVYVVSQSNKNNWGIVNQNHLKIEYLWVGPIKKISGVLSRSHRKTICVVVSREPQKKIWEVLSCKKKMRGAGARENVWGVGSQRKKLQKKKTVKLFFKLAVAISWKYFRGVIVREIFLEEYHKSSWITVFFNSGIKITGLCTTLFLPHLLFWLSELSCSDYTQGKGEEGGMINWVLCCWLALAQSGIHV